MGNLEKVSFADGYQKMIERQKEIYGEFEEDIIGVQKNGLRPNMPDYHGGYSICWRHDDDIIEKVKGVADNVGSYVGSLIYDNKNTVHSTITYIAFGAPDLYEEQKMDLMVRMVENVASVLKKPLIDYTKWLMNYDTVIAAGLADKNFYYSARMIVGACRKLGLDLRMPWGSHITAARFLEKKNGNEVSDLINYVKQVKPVGKSKMSLLEVCKTEYQKNEGVKFMFIRVLGFRLKIVLCFFYD